MSEKYIAYMNFDEFVAGRHYLCNDENMLVESAIGLGSEVGEYQQCVRKAIFEGVKLNTGEVLLELSDIIHYYNLAILALEDKCFISEKMIKVINKAKLYARDLGYGKYFEDYLTNMEIDRNTDILHVVDAVIKEIEDMVEFGKSGRRGKDL